jgi:hypothetical protein
MKWRKSNKKECFGIFLISVFGFYQFFWVYGSIKCKLKLRNGTKRLKIFYGKIQSSTNKTKYALKISKEGEGKKIEDNLFMNPTEISSCYSRTKKGGKRFRRKEE